MSEIILDSSGNIDNRKLEKSLREALDFDIKYKQTDNMKKKACKVASNYDEFKAMVDCAHLKRVSRKEIDSLGSKKQGWTKSSAGKNKKSESSNILSHEANKNKLGNSNTTLLSNNLKSSKGKIKPQTPLELCRDIRRLISKDDKYRYLKEVGITLLTSLMKYEADAELFETICEVLLYGHQQDDHDEIIISGVWFETITIIENFNLLIRFISKENINSIVKILQAHNSSTDIIMKYTSH